MSPSFHGNLQETSQFATFFSLCFLVCITRSLSPLPFPRWPSTCDLVQSNPQSVFVHLPITLFPPPPLLLAWRTFLARSTRNDWFDKSIWLLLFFLSYPSQRPLSSNILDRPATSSLPICCSSNCSFGLATNCLPNGHVRRRNLFSFLFFRLHLHLHLQFGFGWRRSLRLVRHQARTYPICNKTNKTNQHLAIRQFDYQTTSNSPIGFIAHFSTAHLDLFRMLFCFGCSKSRASYSDASLFKWPAFLKHADLTALQVQSAFVSWPKPQSLVSSLHALLPQSKGFNWKINPHHPHRSSYTIFASNFVCFPLIFFGCLRCRSFPVTDHSGHSITRSLVRTLTGQPSRSGTINLMHWI